MDSRRMIDAEKAAFEKLILVTEIESLKKRLGEEKLESEESLNR